MARSSAYGWLVAEGWFVQSYLQLPKYPFHGLTNLQ